MGLDLAGPGSHTVPVGPGPSPTLSPEKCLWAAPFTRTVSRTVCWDAPGGHPLTVHSTGGRILLPRVPRKVTVLMPSAWLVSHSRP